MGSVATANTLYKLDVDIGNRNGANFPGYTMQLWAGAELLAEDVNSLTPANGTFETSVLEVLVGFSTGVGESLEIVLISQGSQTNFDNVKLTADAGDISPDVPFYAVLDGETRRTVATNGVLQLIAFCDPAANEVGLLMTSTADGWFSTGDGSPALRHTGVSSGRGEGLPGYEAILFVRAMVEHPAGYGPLLAHSRRGPLLPSIYSSTLGIREDNRFRGRSPTARTLACLHIAARVSTNGARLATGSGGLTLGRAGFAPAG